MSLSKTEILNELCIFPFHKPPKAPKDISVCFEFTWFVRPGPRKENFTNRFHALFKGSHNVYGDDNYFRELVPLEPKSIT